MHPFVAIDFETANEKRGSACSVGLAKFDAAGQLVDRCYQLLRPHPDLDYFRPINTWVHGLSASDVEGAPNWNDFYPTLQEFVGDLPLVAHNMAFDGYVLRDLNELYGITPLINQRFCTVRLARKLLANEIERKSLDNVYAYFFQDKEFRHHEANDDAYACGMIFARMQEEFGFESLEAALAPVRSPRKKRRREEVLADPAVRSNLKAEFGNSEAVRGECICFTGTLEHGKRADIHSLIETIGAIPSKGITKKTTMLVVGTPNPSTFAEGASGSRKLLKATKLRDAGSPIQVLSEIEFFNLLIDGQADS